VNDKNNEDIPRFPISTPGLYFHSTIDMLKYLTEGSEVGLSQAMQKLICAAQSCDKKTGESYNSPSALSH
jgi:hypothetical protein